MHRHVERHGCSSASPPRCEAEIRYLPPRERPDRPTRPAPALHRPTTKTAAELARRRSVRAWAEMLTLVFVDEARRPPHGRLLAPLERSPLELRLSRAFSRAFSSRAFASRAMPVSSVRLSRSSPLERSLSKTTSRAFSRAFASRAFSSRAFASRAFSSRAFASSATDASDAVRRAARVIAPHSAACISSLVAGDATVANLGVFFFVLASLRDRATATTDPPTSAARSAAGARPSAASRASTRRIGCAPRAIVDSTRARRPRPSPRLSSRGRTRSPPHAPRRSSRRAGDSDARRKGARRPAAPGREGTKSKSARRPHPRPPARRATEARSRRASRPTRARKRRTRTRRGSLIRPSPPPPRAPRRSTRRAPAPRRHLRRSAPRRHLRRSAPRRHGCAALGVATKRTSVHVPARSSRISPRARHRSLPTRPRVGRAELRAKVHPRRTAAPHRPARFSATRPLAAQARGARARLRRRADSRASTTPPRSTPRRVRRRRRGR